MNLLDFRSDKYSSTGNDGIIEYIFKTLGRSRGFFAEFGAWDGIVGSNCKKLVEEGWNGVFIESDPKRYADLVNNYKDTNIICVNTTVGGAHSFDEIMVRCTKHIDFCSIDIDGLDLEVFETFKDYLPDVVCIEGGQMLHPDHPRISLKKAKDNVQQSLGVMAKSFSAKGYKPICSYQDTFFVKQKYYDKFDVSSNLMDLYLDGLAAHARRIPWIMRRLKRNKLSNPILAKILKRAKFSKYGWANRKKWAAEKNDRIIQVIDEIRNHG